MLNPVKEAQPGDILYAKNNKNVNGIPSHYMVYLGPSAQAGIFMGAMLTSSDKHGNTPLQIGHFETTDPSGNPWQITYKNSHVVSQLFYKKDEWGPFSLVGRMTNEGLNFILQTIGGTTPSYFAFNK